MFKHVPPTATPLHLSAIRHTWGEKRPLTTFTTNLKAYLGIDHLFLAASGRTTLFLLLKTLCEASPKRDKVLLPAYTCPALGKVILDAGLRPVFIDISPHTFRFDMAQLNYSLHEDCLALIAVHPFGIPIQLDDVMTLAQAQGVLVIEDAAQALGARWEGQPVGTRGDFGLYSLGPGKPLSTGGGGVLVTQSAQWAGRLAARWHGLTAGNGVTAVMRYLLFMAAFHPRGWWWATRLGSHRFGESEAGQSYQLSGLNAAQAKIGLAHLPLLDGWNETRRRHAARWQDWLVREKRPYLHFPLIAPEAEPIFLRLPLLVETPEKREQLYWDLWQQNIGVGRMYRKTMPQLFPHCAATPHPGAQQLAACLLTLPTNHYVNLPPE